MKHQKPCIFCGRYGDKSKEHFYPDWVGDFIKQTDVHNTATTVTQKGLGTRTISANHRRQGHLITKTFRVVCRSCNNGWMSQVESTAKPALVSGLTKTTLVLGPDQQRDLATWVCLKSMVCEHSDPKLASTPFKDRHSFFKDRAIPSYFRIYVGAHATSSETWLHRHSATISFSSKVRPPLMDGLQRNVQTVTFILGQLVFHVLAARVDGFGLDTDITYPGLTRLWPSLAESVDTSKLRVLHLEHLRQLVTSFDTYLRHQNPKFTDNIV